MSYIEVNYPSEKTEFYTMLREQVKLYTDGETDRMAVLSNTSSVIAQAQTAKQPQKKAVRLPNARMLRLQTSLRSFRRTARQPEKPLKPRLEQDRMPNTKQWKAEI